MSRVNASPLSVFARWNAEATAAPRLSLWTRIKHRMSSWSVGMNIESSWASRWGTALAAVAIATLARQLMDPWLQHRAAYGTYLMAVLFVAWRAGWGPSLLTLVVGMFLGRILFDPPRWTLSLASESNQAALFMSLAIGVLATYFCESLRVQARFHRRLYELARDADARKDEFLATLAHELRNPLMPIRTAIYLLEQKEQREPQEAELHAMLDRHAEHLTRLVNDLLDVSRITQRKIELKSERIALANVVSSALEVVQPLILEKRQELKVNLPTTAVWLKADGVRLTQVITNLLHNAAKYTGAEGRLWLTAKVETSDLVLRVRDTGIGIPPAMCQRVFDLFQQVHQGIEYSQGGLGIGLTLVRELVQLHGGTVEAHSAGVDLGSEFIVRLPIIDRSLDAQKLTRSAIASARGSGDSLRILVVDDSPGVTRSLEMILTDWKHVVHTCGDGFAAIEAATSFQPDFVLADLSMPRMSGYALAQELRRLPATKDAVLIAVSGFGQEADRERSQTAGFDRHLTKPVDLVELKELLRVHRQAN